VADGVSVIIDEQALLELRAERDDLGNTVTDLYEELDQWKDECERLTAEIARLRALMTGISKGLGYAAHIIATYDGTTKPIYTCGIHNIAMGPHGDRCPECDRS
jgi:hypothetical protein